MPTPSSTQAANRLQGPWAMAKAASPSAKTTLVAISTGLPPQRSMLRPAYGPSSAETTIAQEKAANTIGTETPMSLAMGTARMAGR